MKTELKQESFKMTELGLLPEEWEVVRLGEVGEIITGTTPSTAMREYYGGQYLFVSPGDMGEAKYVTKTQKYLSEKGFAVSHPLPRDTVLVVCIGATIGKTAMTFTEQSATNQQINAIIPNEKAFALCLYYIIGYRSHSLPSLAGRAAVPIVNKSNFTKFFIPLPPLPEQKKIAAVLSCVQEAKEKTGAVIKATRELKKSLMKHLFAYGPVPVGAIRELPLQETEIGLVPKEWEVVRLGEICEIKGGGTPSKVKAEYWESGAIPWIKSERCQDNYVTMPSGYITEEGLNNSSAKMLRPKTVLVAMVGATIGKTGFLTFSACTNQNVAGLYPLNENINNVYLFYAIQSRYKEFTKTGGYTIANLSFIKSFQIPLPPLPTQQKIADILSAVDKKIQAEENKKKALENLFKTLLHNLMTGKIRLNYQLKNDKINRGGSYYD